MVLVGLVLVAQIISAPANAQSTSEPDTLQWYEFEEVTDLEDDSRPILLFMEAEWCGICKQMHREVFTDSSITQYLNDHFYPVKMDIESDAQISFKGKSMTQKSFSMQMKLQATPTMIFLRPNHTVIGSKPGFADVKELNMLLDYIASNAWEEMTMREFQKKHSKN